MKCEYCDNPVPIGITRCPSCGATVPALEGSSVGGAAIGGVSPTVPVQIPGAYVIPDAQMNSLRGKNKWVYILLGLFLGEFGIHNFYTGYIGRGIVKLLITILSFGYLCWISWIWAIVEICTVRIDSRGVPFSS